MTENEQIDEPIINPIVPGGSPYKSDNSDTDKSGTITEPAQESADRPEPFEFVPPKMPVMPIMQTEGGNENDT